MRTAILRLVLAAVGLLCVAPMQAHAQRACDENYCYASFAEADAALRATHPAGRFVRQKSSYVSETATATQTTIVYEIPNEPPEAMAQPGYIMNGWGTAETGCAPSESDGAMCADEQWLIDYYQAYVRQSVCPGANFRNERMAGSHAAPFQQAASVYTGRSGNPGVLFFYNQPDVRRWEYEINCPGWGTGEYSLRDAQLQKKVVFRCPSGLYARDGYSPAYAPAGTSQSALIDYPYLCYSNDRPRITVFCPKGQAADMLSGRCQPNPNGLGPCNCPGQVENHVGSLAPATGSRGSVPRLDAWNVDRRGAGTSG